MQRCVFLHNEARDDFPLAGLHVVPLYDAKWSVLGAAAGRHALGAVEVAHLGKVDHDAALAVDLHLMQVQ